MIAPRYRNFVFIFALVLAPLACAIDEPRAKTADESPAKEPTRTVLWISVDGVRPDYVDRGETPTLDRLMREGAYSRELVPVFPSLTFPSHVSQATGVKVREHGIPANSFIDISRRPRPGRNIEPYRYPPWANMMRAEPIWLTAARQNVRVASIDWPVSHDQRGEVRAEYFGDRYEGRLTDRQRIEVLLDIWENDEKRGEDDPPLRLLMGYVVGPDSAGHEFGPDAREPIEKLEETDRLLGEVIDKALALWARDWQGRDDAELWILLTTDHGMSAVHSLVHLGHLAGLDDSGDTLTVTSGNVGHIFFARDREIEESDPQRVQAMIDRINQHEFARAWRRSDLPEEWEYDHPTRTGDIVIVLDAGYTFSARPLHVTAPAAEHGGPLGMHGYDPRTNAEMNGLMVVWRHPQPLGGVNLNRVHSLQLHATAAKLLGIEPAPKARRDAIEALFRETPRQTPMSAH